MSFMKHNPCAALERLFHEPGRLAIMSTLCGADGRLSFTELKMECGMTDGNLNRHLHVLRQARAVDLRKGYAGLRPRTTVWATDEGRSQFLDYLRALETVLQRARDAVGTDQEVGAASVAMDGAVP